VNPSGKIVLQGHRDMASKLWIFSLLSPPLCINNTVQFSRHADRVLYYNRCFCSCANSTMIDALQTKILVIPDLPLSLYMKHVPNHLPQAFGHLDRSRKGLRSTKKITVRSRSPLSGTSAEPIESHPVIYVKDFSSHRYGSFSN
jgi:hypothetical protein